MHRVLKRAYYTSSWWWKINTYRSFVEWLLRGVSQVLGVKSVLLPLRPPHPRMISWNWVWGFAKFIDFCYLQEYSNAFSNDEKLVTSWTFIKPVHFLLFLCHNSEILLIESRYIWCPFTFYLQGCCNNCTGHLFMCQKRYEISWWVRQMRLCYTWKCSSLSPTRT